MRRGTIDHNCDYCGNMIKVFPYELKEQEIFFCSRNCHNLFKTNKIKCTCAYCGKELLRVPSEIKKNDERGGYNRFYCDRDCQVLHHAKRVVKNRKRNGEWIPCENCGQVAYYFQRQLDRHRNGELNGFFCSPQCAGFINAGKYFPDAKLSSNYRGPNWKEQREKALFRDGYTCRICSFTDGTLDVHHIKPFREFGYIPDKNDNYLLANDIDNLITACKSCHLKIERGSISPDELQLILSFL